MSKAYGYRKVLPSTTWVLAIALLGTSASATAATTIITVTGNDNPFLAGQPAGTACCGGDSAPSESPASFTGFAAGSDFTFTPSGFTNGAGYGDVGPEGASNFNMNDFGTGIAPALGVGINALLGVFLSDAAPTAATQPGSLDFNGNRSFASLTPGLNQIFYIGDGLTGTGSGSLQVFTAPTGATRLFLGVADGFGWYNNAGTLAVSTTFTPALAAAVPEPTSWALMLIGFGAVGEAMRRRQRTSVSFI